MLAAHLDHHDAAALIAIAQRTPAGRLGAAIAAWPQRHDAFAHTIADGGTTALDALQRLCGPHNRAQEPHPR